MKRAALASLAATVHIAATASRAADVTVFAAASLTDALKEIATAYEKESGDKVVFNFAASSTLARQIEAGAPADVFFSADEAQMDGLDKKGMIENDTRTNRLSNSLVVVQMSDTHLPIGTPQGLAGPQVKHIALADPKTVPAGVYAKAWLEKRQLWSAVESKVIPTENVRAALAAVESGNVEAAIVYKTDAAISRKVKVTYEVPRTDVPDISYPMALVKDSRQREASRKFLQHLDSANALRVFEKFGFIIRK
jgi:molybdate transport system substrate-binding protein